MSKDVDPTALREVLRQSTRAVLRSPLVLPTRIATPGVKLQAVGNEVIVSSGTSSSIGKPSGSQSGDLLVLIQVSTSTPGTPAGWTLQYSVTNVSFTQRLDIFTAPGSAATPFNITQATAGVMQGIILCFRATQFAKTLSIGANSTGSVFQSTANPQPMQSLTPFATGLALSIGVCSKTGSGALITPSAGWTQLLSTGVFNQRIGLAWRYSVIGVALSGTFQSNSYATDGSANANWNKALINIKAS